MDSVMTGLQRQEDSLTFHFAIMRAAVLALCWLWKFLWFYNDWSCIYQIVIVFLDRLPRLSEGWRARRVNSSCSFWKYRAYGKVPGLSSGKWICPLILPQARKSIRGLILPPALAFQCSKILSISGLSLSWCLQKGGGTTVAWKYEYEIVRSIENVVEINA